MIFGFNTDVKVGNTVYHVQSEARNSEMLFQTEVFLNGRLLGKQARSYANLAIARGASETGIQEALKHLHLEVVQAAQDGEVEKLLLAHPKISDVGGAGIYLHWLNPEIAKTKSHDSWIWILRFSVTDQDLPLEGAQLTCRLEASESAPVQARAQTGSDGVGELLVVHADLPELSHDRFVIVRAEHGSKSATRKFRLGRR